jgi:serine/threonine protein kinase
MELCSGGSLLERLQKVGHFEEAHAAACIAMITHAVGFLHDHAVCHRDIKPQNILFKDHSPSSPLILVDFGVASVSNPNMPQSAGAAGMTTLAGTPYFLAPELLSNLNNRPYTNKIDIWSIGILAHQMLIGHTPFQDSLTFAELYRRIREVDFEIAGHEPVSALGRGFIRTLLQPDPDLRPTAQQALRHPWITHHCSASYLERLHQLNVEADPEMYGSASPNEKALPDIPLDANRDAVHGKVAATGRLAQEAWDHAVSLKKSSGRQLDEVTEESKLAISWANPESRRFVLTEGLTRSFPTDTAPANRLESFDLPNLRFHHPTPPAQPAESQRFPSPFPASFAARNDYSDVRRMESTTTMRTTKTNSTGASTAFTLVSDLMRPQQFRSEDLSRAFDEWPAVTNAKSMPIMSKTSQTDPAFYSAPMLASAKPDEPSSDGLKGKMEEYGSGAVWDMIELNASSMIRRASMVSDTPGSPNPNAIPPASPPAQPANSFFVPMQSPSRSPNPSFASLPRQVRRGSSSTGNTFGMEPAARAELGNLRRGSFDLAAALLPKPNQSLIPPTTNSGVTEQANRCRPR